MGLDFGKLLGAVGNAVTGNWGGAIQSTLEGVGITPSTPPKEVEKILQNNPEVQIALLNAQTEQLRIKSEAETEKLRLENDSLKAEKDAIVRDLESARNLSQTQMNTGKTMFERSQILYFGVAIVVGMSFFIFNMMTNQIIYTNYKDMAQSDIRWNQSDVDRNKLIQEYERLLTGG